LFHFLLCRENCSTKVRINKKLIMIGKLKLVYKGRVHLGKKQSHERSNGQGGKEEAKIEQVFLKKL